MAATGQIGPYPLRWSGQDTSTLRGYVSFRFNYTESDIDPVTNTSVLTISDIEVYYEEAYSGASAVMAGISPSSSEASYYASGTDKPFIIRYGDTEVLHLQQREASSYALLAGNQRWYPVIISSTLSSGSFVSATIQHDADGTKSEKFSIDCFINSDSHASYESNIVTNLQSDNAYPLTPIDPVTGLPIYVNVNGTVIQVSEVYANVGGTIKQCSVYANVGGVIKAIQ